MDLSSGSDGWTLGIPPTFRPKVRSRDRQAAHLSRIQHLELDFAWRTDRDNKVTDLHPNKHHCEGPSNQSSQVDDLHDQLINDSAVEQAGNNENAFSLEEHAVLRSKQKP